MLQIDRETVHKMFFQFMERFDKIDQTLERMNKLKSCLKVIRCWRTMTSASCSASPNERWRVTARKT